MFASSGENTLTKNYEEGPEFKFKNKTQIWKFLNFFFYYYYFYVIISNYSFYIFIYFHVELQFMFLLFD